MSTPAGRGASAPRTRAYYHPQEAAEVLGLTVPELSRWLTRARVPVSVVRKVHMIRADAVDGLASTMKPYRWEAPGAPGEAPKTGRGRGPSPRSARDRFVAGIKRELSLMRDAATGRALPAARRRGAPKKRGVDGTVRRGFTTPPQVPPTIEDNPAYALLSRRTSDRLKVAGVEYVEDLRAVPADTLLKIPQFGVGCLREVEAFLDAQPNGPAPYPTKETSAPRSLKEFLALLANDEGVRGELERWTWRAPGGATSHAAELLAEVARGIAEGALDANAPMDWPPLLELSARLTPVATSLEDLLQRTHHAVAGGAISWPEEEFSELLASLDATLEDEVSGLLAGINERARAVLRARHGPVPNRKKLADLGEEFGVSRERVRQIQVGAAGALSRSYAERPLPRFRSAMMAAATAPGGTRKNAAEAVLGLGAIGARGERLLDDFFAVWGAISPKTQPYPAHDLDGVPPKNR